MRIARKKEWGGMKKPIWKMDLDHATPPGDCYVGKASKHKGNKYLIFNQFKQLHTTFFFYCVNLKAKQVNV